MYRSPAMPLSARAHVEVDRLAARGDRVLGWPFREKAAALRQHAGLLQDLLLHGTTLDREDLALLDGQWVPG